MGYSGAGGKLIHKKTRSKKSRDTVPLILSFFLFFLDKRRHNQQTETDLKKNLKFTYNRLLNIRC